MTCVCPAAQTYVNPTDNALFHEMRLTGANIHAVIAVGERELACQHDRALSQAATQVRSMLGRKDKGPLMTQPIQNGNSGEALFGDQCDVHLDLKGHGVEPMHNPRFHACLTFADGLYVSAYVYVCVHACVHA